MLRLFLLCICGFALMTACHQRPNTTRVASEAQAADEQVDEQTTNEQPAEAQTVECPASAAEARALEVDCMVEQPTCVYDEGQIQCSDPACQGIQPHPPDRAWRWQGHYEEGCPRSSFAWQSACEESTLRCTGACGTGVIGCVEGAWQYLEMPTPRP